MRNKAKIIREAKCADWPGKVPVYTCCPEETINSSFVHCPSVLVWLVKDKVTLALVYIWFMVKE